MTVVARGGGRSAGWWSRARVVVGSGQVVRESG